MVLTDAASALAVEVEEAVDEASPFAAGDRESLRAFRVCERLFAVSARVTRVAHLFMGGSSHRL